MQTSVCVSWSLSVSLSLVSLSIFFVLHRFFRLCSNLFSSSAMCCCCRCLTLVCFLPTRRREKKTPKNFTRNCVSLLRSAWHQMEANFYCAFFQANSGNTVAACVGIFVPFSRIHTDMFSKWKLHEPWQKLVRHTLDRIINNLVFLAKWKTVTGSTISFSFRTFRIATNKRTNEWTGERRNSFWHNRCSNLCTLPEPDS